MAKSIIDFLQDYNVRVTDSLDAPVLTASGDGSSGASQATYTYKASYITLVGQSLCSDEVEIEWNATLNGFNRVLLSVSNVPASVTYVRFWKKIDDVWYKIADVAPDVAQLYDINQTLTVASVPVSNTSGRPGVIAVGLKPGQFRQRITDMDLQAIQFRINQALWDTVFRDGDIKKGCKEVIVSGTLRENSKAYSLGDVIYVSSTSPIRYECTTAGTSASSDPGSWSTTVGTTKTDGTAVFTAICRYTFSAGEMYLFGVMTSVPEATLNLQASGTEKVGVLVSPAVTTIDDDIVQRAGIDERVPQIYANTGPDWIYLQVTWAVDEVGQINVKEFYDGSPKLITAAPERTEWEKVIADRINDISGACTLESFSLTVSDHSTDPTKLMLTIGKGTAYPNGFKTQVPAETKMAFNKARTTRVVNNAILDAFSAPGGHVISGNTETFNLSGKSLKLKVGQGNYHTVTFVSDSMTAEDVADYINAAVNAYPTSSSMPIVDCSANDGLVEIQAKAGKSLEIAAVTSDCYTVLGISTGTYTPEGQRVYPIGNGYVKQVDDVSYLCEYIEAVSHNGTTHIDSLGNSNIGDLIGASDTLADCEDAKWDYQYGVDFTDGTSDGTISFASMGGDEPTGTYYLKYTYNRNPVKGTRKLVRVVDAQITKGTEYGTDLLVTTGATAITRVNADGTAGSAISVTGVPTEIMRVLGVHNAAGQGITSSDYSAYELLLTSDTIKHDQGEISWENAGAHNTGSTGQPTTGATYYISYEFWYHDLEGDFVSADSYDLYDQIGHAFSSNIYVLRDCVDFRTTSGYVPVPSYHPIIDYTQYLGRVDKIFLDDLGNFTILGGTPSTDPKIPYDQSPRLAIGLMYVAPYTYNYNWVNTQKLGTPITNQEALQNLIGRVENLEYWKALSDLENEVANSPAADSSIGVFTDALTGFGKMDLGFNKNGVRHTAALDINKQCLLLPTESPVQISLTVDEENSVNVKRVGKTLMIEYVPELFMEQPYATDSINCASDYEITAYRGSATLNPPSDCFTDREQLPAINVDFDNNLQPLVDALVDQGALAMNEVVWGNWTYHYDATVLNSFGQGWANMAADANAGGYWAQPADAYEYDYDTGQYTHVNAGVSGTRLQQYFNQVYNGFYLNRTPEWMNRYGASGTSAYMTETSWRDGVRRTLIPGSETVSLGNSVANLTMTGRVRTTNSDGSPFEIHVEAHSLMPNQDHALVIGGIPVNFVYDSSPSAHYGSAGTLGHTYQGKTTVKTNNDGRLTGKFQVPSGLTGGTISVSIFHYPYPDTSNATCYFSSTGFMQQNRETTIGLPTYQYTSNNIHENGETRTIYNNYYDPLAQTFVIPDEITYISEVEVFFRTKHSTLPIRLEVRNATESGEPGSTVLATGMLEAADVDVSEDGTVGSTFELDTVLGYTAGTEYALVLFPSLNNTGYTVWTAKVGNIDVKTGAMVMAQTNDGVLFHSPNSRVWEPYTKNDLKFKLYKSNFVDNAAIVFEHISGISASLFVTAVQEFIGSGTKASWWYSVDDQDTWVPFLPNIDTTIGSIVTDIDLRLDVTSLGASYQMISPIAGIVFLLHKSSANAVFINEYFTEELYYPNQVKVYLDLDTDGVNGTGVTSVTPMFSWDNGETWVEVEQDTSYTPTAAPKKSYYRYLFSTPSQATLSAATNASPIVITSASHNFKENTVVEITGVVGNTAANGVWMLKNVTDNTAELYQLDRTTASTGNGAYSEGGSMETYDIAQLRPRLYLSTTNQARTPRIMNVSFIATRA